MVSLFVLSCDTGFSSSCSRQFHSPTPCKSSSRSLNECSSPSSSKTGQWWLYTTRASPQCNTALFSFSLEHFCLRFSIIILLCSIAVLQCTQTSRGWLLQDVALHVCTGESTIIQMARMTLRFAYSKLRLNQTILAFITTDMSVRIFTLGHIYRRVMTNTY